MSKTERPWWDLPAGRELQGQGAQKGQESYFLYILNIRIGERNACHPHGTAVSIGAFPIKLGSCRFKHIIALGAQELLEDVDNCHPVAPVGFLLVFLSKPAVVKKASVTQVRKNTRDTRSVTEVAKGCKRHFIG